MNIRELIGDQVAALVEFYDDSLASEEANKLVEQVKEILGPDAPVYRINVQQEPREADLVRLKTVPTIIIYRNHREEWVITNDDLPTAQALAQRLEASMDAPGAINPLKGRPRY